MKKARAVAPSAALAPVLVASAVILQLYAQNSQKLRFSECVRSLVVAASFACLCHLLARWICRGRRDAFVVSTIWVLLGFAYGPLANVLAELPAPLHELGRLRALLPAIGLVSLGVAYLGRTRKTPPIVASLVWNIAWIAFSLAVLRGALALGSGGSGPELDLPRPELVVPEAAPDIYYIVLDAYGREDLLRSHYDFDNSDFIAQLESRGFDVLDWSRSNYDNTVFSLASTLSLGYLDDLLEQVDEASRDERTLHRLVQEPHVPQLFRDAGYRFVSFATGVAATEMKSADRYLRSNWQIREFESVVLQSTALASLLSRSGLPIEFAGRRNGIRYTLGHLGRLEGDGTPQFVIAHLLSPHSPFIFGPNGEARNPRMPHPSSDGSDYLRNATAESYRQGYVEQLQYLNRRLLESVDTILENAKQPPVIILQGDHGPRLGLDWEDVDATDTAEVSSTFCAILLPGFSEERIPEDLSSVNTFRFLTRELFGARLEDLPYRFSASPRSDMYRFVDRTAQTVGPPREASER